MGEDKKQIQLIAQKTGSGTILQGPIVPVLFSVSVPLMVTNLINAIYNLTDGLWVAQISLIDFSATSFIWPPHYLFVSLGIGISIAGTAIISQLIGAGDKERAESYATHVFYFCLFLGVFFSIAGYFLAPSIVRWMGATGTLQKSATTYFSVLMTGFVFEMVYLSFYAILGAQGKTRVTTIISAISAVMNIVLDPLFMFARVPLINVPGLGMGIAGAAWATVISQAVRMILGAVAIRSNINEVRLRLRKTKLTTMQFGRLVRTGFPTALGQSSAALGFTLMHSLIVAYGDATITAYAAVNRVTVSYTHLDVYKRQELKNAESIVFADFKGLTVKQDTEMRAAFRNKGLTYRVVKNTISERAFEQLGIKGLEETLKGPTAIAYSSEDVVLAPRMVREFTEKFRRLKIKGGVIGGEVHDIDYIMALSRVESRENLYGQLLFMMLYPLTAFAQVAGQIAEKGAEAGVEKVADLLTTDGKTVAEDGQKEADDAEKDVKADAEKATEETSAEASEEAEKDTEEVSS